MPSQCARACAARPLTAGIPLCDIAGSCVRGKPDRRCQTFEKRETLGRVPERSARRYPILHTRAHTRECRLALDGFLGCTREKISSSRQKWEYLLSQKKIAAGPGPDSGLAPTQQTRVFGQPAHSPDHEPRQSAYHNRLRSASGTRKHCPSPEFSFPVASAIVTGGKDAWQIDRRRTCRGCPSPCTLPHDRACSASPARARAPGKRRCSLALRAAAEGYRICMPPLGVGCANLLRSTERADWN